ncbi:hypothetical protein M404DRAFT_529600 [Pisolithus tinctorius Marx 270]|uniref:Uncharacterized protein n=1 Tax=Pisolithus tinctorius Marx 270 TaxID=870435 RepID=A0A0C3NVS5_PISTI|nr:hypothetical protein M404DRAFT_529600 [Pisolithus tinctorius Marx 270]
MPFEDQDDYSDEQRSVLAVFVSSEITIVDCRGTWVSSFLLQPGVDPLVAIVGAPPHPPNPGSLRVGEVTDIIQSRRVFDADMQREVKGNRRNG